MAWHDDAKTRLDQATAIYRASLTTSAEQAASAQGIPMVHTVHVDEARTRLFPRRAPIWLSTVAAVSGVVFGVASGGVVNILTNDGVVAKGELIGWLIPTVASLATSVFAYTAKHKY